MKVIIAGGHGKIALRLSRKLADHGDEVHGMIRNPGHQEDLHDAGVVAVVLDLESTPHPRLAEALAGADAIVFAAGAGPGSGSERKETVDFGAAAKLIDAARQASVERYVMLSAMGTDDPPTDDDVFSIYLRAKARADQALMDSDRAWTIVRPGGLTDDDGTGAVTLARHVGRGRIPREDVAAVIAACLHDERTAGHVFELVSGDTPIDEAIETLVT